MAKYGVVFSGGLDSVVLLYDLVAKHGADEVVAIGIDFGQQEVNEDERGLSFANNIIERDLIQKVPAKLGVKVHMVDLSSLGFVLEFMQERIAKHGKRINGKSLSLFPGRNFILAFIAGCVAETYGCEEVCMVFPNTDYAVLENGETLGSYTSSRLFLNELNKLVDKSADMTVKFTTPLNHLSKAGEIRLGKHLGVDFKEDVWTCLHPKSAVDDKGDDKELIQCGTCKPCVRNRVSFTMAGVEDPYTYYSDDFKVDERLYTQLKLAGDPVEILDDLGVVEHGELQTNEQR